MAEIAKAVQTATPRQPTGSLDIRGPISKFSRVLDTASLSLDSLGNTADTVVRQDGLVTTYLSLADSLCKTRGGLKRDDLY